MNKSPLPEDGHEYSATLVDGQVHVAAVGTSGRLEFGLLVTVEGFGDRLWFAVVIRSHTVMMARIAGAARVKFRSAMYYSHVDEPRRIGLHDDARFEVVVDDDMSSVDNPKN